MFIQIHTLYLIFQLNMYKLCNCVVHSFFADTQLFKKRRKNWRWMTYRNAPCGVLPRWLSGELPMAFDEDYSASEAVCVQCSQQTRK